MQNLIPVKYTKFQKHKNIIVTLIKYTSRPLNLNGEGSCSLHQNGKCSVADSAIICDAILYNIIIIFYIDYLLNCFSFFNYAPVYSYW